MPFPKKSPDDLHDSQLRIRVTSSEKSALSGRARMAGMSVSRYVRDAALGRRIASRVDMQAINELRRVGGLMKLGMAKDPLHREDYAALLADTRQAIRALVDEGSGDADRTG